MAPRTRNVEVPVERVDVSAYTIPTDFPESDGTLVWDSTTMVLVEIFAGGKRGTGFTYADTATARLIQDRLAGVIQGMNAMAVPELWDTMGRSIRNLGGLGISAMAISGIDVALWDLKAQLLDLPLVSLLGAARAAIPVYGSGGFTSYSITQLQEQFSRWVSEGISRVKMKIGRDPEAGPARAAAAREAIGPETALFVDANGAYSRKQALAMANAFAEFDVTWFDEPVPADVSKDYA
jgi:L-alanine-DL-glutamate epimerase-like enolase superfamily enzyme